MTSNIYKEYWGEPDKQKQSWILPVETCCNHHGGDYAITFPDDLIEAVGWKITWNGLTTMMDHSH
jgi:hypothetical protein